jgi:predicted AAA+ superfamily ATPase
VTRYIDRIVDAELKAVVGELPAVAIEGPKAVGKTATAKRIATTTIEMEKSQVRENVAAAPERVMGLPGPVLIDEWQRWPEIWDWVRRAVDADAPAGQYLLTGSAYPITASIHSGAGRIVTVRMRPLSLVERGLETATVSLDAALRGELGAIEGSTRVALPEYVEEIARSGFPAIRRLSPMARELQLHDYLDRVANRAFRDQGHDIRRPETLMRWMRAFAAATSTIASYSTVLDMATPGEGNKPAKTTTIAYRDVLSSLWLLDEVSPWLDGDAYYSRLAISPKHFLADPALALTLLELSPEELLDGEADTRLDATYGSITGRLFEALVAQSLQVYAQAVHAQLHHFRTADGIHEVDFIVHRRRRTVAIEVKLAATVTDHDVKHLRWLRQRMGSRLTDAMVITAGPTAYRRADGIAVVPAALLKP